MKQRLLLFISVCFLFLPVATAQKVIYVNDDATGNNTGSSWSNAYTSFQSALSAAVSGDQIWVASGIYKPSSDYGLGDGSNARLYHFRMKEGVAIYGGFNGTETSLSQRNFYAYPTILSGDVGTPEDNSDNCYHIFFHPETTGLTNAAILDGFTLTGANANGQTDPHYRGGAIYNYGASPLLRNVVIKENSASYGGAIYCEYGSFKIINALIINNSASYGGASYSFAAGSEFINVTVVKNTGRTLGGGFYNGSSNETLKNCIIWGNKSVLNPYGHDIYISGGTFNLYNNCYKSDGVFYSSGAYFYLNAGNITSYPEFVDPDNGNYAIAQNSPCLNTGGNSYNALSTDIRGNARIQNTTIDMGAYEWTSGTDPVREARIIYVDAKKSDDSGDGFSWATAKKTLQAALDISLRLDQIWVSAGTYYPTSSYTLTNSSRYYHFEMKEGVAIYGGFAGTETSPEGRSLDNNQTILSGDIGVANDNSDNSYHVIYNPAASGLTSAAILDGFTITGGNADGTATELYGGGICNLSSPSMRNITITGNSASYGAGIYNENSTSVVENVLLTDNTATYGGAICNKSSSPRVINATISNNSASYGGGVYNESSSMPVFYNSVFWGNTATGNNGNEFFNAGGTTTLNYCCYPNATGDVVNTGGTFISSNNNISVDPMFINAAGGNYRLYGSSLCVNGGMNDVSTCTTDIRGQKRIQISTIDMGAYEWTSGEEEFSKKRIIYVNQSSTGIHNGSSWENAMTSLQPALDASVSGDTIWVAAGTYKPTSSYNLTNSPRYYHFRMKEGVAIYGGFAGTETALKQRSDFGPGQSNETILSGDIGNEGDNSDNCYHLFFHPDGSGLTSAAILNGFTITGGNANCSSGSPHNSGAGMYNYNSSPGLTNITFINNNANYEGGALYCFGSSSVVSEAVIANNYAPMGGGIFNDASSVTFTNTTFAYNSASDYSGGAIYNDSDAKLTINNSVLWGDYSAANAYLIYNWQGIININNSCYNSKNSIQGGTFNAVNCITSDPSFVDAVKGDYRIYGISSCVNTGDNSFSSSKTDICGHDRIIGKAIDMGAYEWSSEYVPHHSGSATIFVSASAAGSNNGGNWANAYASLQQALDIAVSGDQIWVAKGTYKPSVDYGLGTNSDARLYHFRMKDNVAIYGGFAGTESSPDERTSFGRGQTNETILSGYVGAENNTADNCYHVLYLPDGSGLTSSAILDGFTITGGNANGNDYNSKGGGIYSDNNQGSFKNLHIFNNLAGNNSSASGAGAFLTRSNVTFLNISITNNISSWNGGGLAIENGSPSFTNCLISDNNSVHGAGIYLGQSAGNVLFDNVTVVKNIAIANFDNNGSGAGIYACLGGIGTFNNSVIWDNKADGNDNEINLFSGTGQTNTTTITLNFSCYGDFIVNDRGTFDASNNNIHEDPMLVDESKSDYRLNGNSPCVNTGNKDYNTSQKDLRGYTRVQDGNIDMGAYEWTFGVDQMKINRPLAFSFASSSGSGTLTFKMQCNKSDTCYIDWGHGKIAMATQKTDLSDYNISTFTSGDIVKVYATGVTHIDVASQLLTSINVSDCPDLVNLNCQGNGLTSLNVSKNASLQSLNCSNNKLSSLDVSTNASLT